VSLVAGKNRQSLQQKTRGVRSAPRVPALVLIHRCVIVLVVAVILSAMLGGGRSRRMMCWPSSTTISDIMSGCRQTHLYPTTGCRRLVDPVPRFSGSDGGIRPGGSGAALQGMFRNPLADPALIGVSGGAALGQSWRSARASWCWAGGRPRVCLHGRLLFALLGYALARQNGRTEGVTLILAASRSILCGRGHLVDHVHCHIRRSGRSSLTMGSLGGATWSNVAAAAPFVLAGWSFPFGGGNRSI